MKRQRGVIELLGVAGIFVIAATIGLAVVAFTHQSPYCNPAATSVCNADGTHK